MDNNPDHFTPLALRMLGNNKFLGELGAELWTNLGGGEVPGRFYFQE